MAEVTIQEMGISFTVYTEEGNIDRAWPFDIIPRTISAPLWKTTAEGLTQRLKALNMFIDDLYHEQKIIKDGIIPEHIIKESKNFRPECVGVNPAHGVWAHICGTDLVRDADGQFYVLEDNLRVPSGVSYMLENRAITKRVLPEMFEKENILPLDDYPEQLFDMLISLSPREIEEPEIVVLTPGIFNSAYFEHAFLAQQMGVELVEGSDLFVDDDDCVYMKTISGPERVDVIYRRIDDLFIDPDVFDKDSVLGVPGMMRAWQAGNVALANAPGAGVADDKVVYAYVPQIIEYYLNEKPILPNVETFLCEDPEQRAYVLDNLDKLVIKPANESGGYGMLGFGHGPSQVIDAMGQNQVMANIMTPNFSQLKLDNALRSEIGRDTACPYDRFLCLNSGSEAVTVGARTTDINATLQTDPGGRHAGKPIRILGLKGAFHGRTDRPARIRAVARPCGSSR